MSKVCVKFWQIWPFHVTQEANFEKNLFFPNSTFNIRKSYKIYSRKALYFRSYQPKTSRGVENTPPPVLLGLNLEPLEQHPNALTTWLPNNTSPIPIKLHCQVISGHINTSLYLPFLQLLSLRIQAVRVKIKIYRSTKQVTHWYAVYVIFINFTILLFLKVQYSFQSLEY